MTATFYVGDAITVMNTLPEKSVDLILTSPPFLALRSYLPQDHPDKALEGGSQATPGAYVDWLLDVVEACARVLARHGSLCFELGDTYSGSDSAWSVAKDRPQDDDGGYQSDQRVQYEGHRAGIRNMNQKIQGGGPGWAMSKSLSLIPESFRFAMVYGRNPHTGRTTEPWRLRNVIRWVRPNPPVGALGDKFRPATSELMVFCKAKDRFFDLDAVRETPTTRPQRRFSNEWGKRGGDPKAITYGDAYLSDELTRFGNPAGAPPLDWWNIPPGGYPGAHYAVWPPELLVKPIKAMCPEKVCRRCGEASRRITETQTLVMDGPPNNRRVRGPKELSMKPAGESKVNRKDSSGLTYQGQDYVTVVLNETWTDCGHDNYRPGLVLDPFAGSGTTLSVATGHGRDAIGIDLDERNYELALDRVGPLVLTRAA